MLVRSAAWSDAQAAIDFMLEGVVHNLEATPVYIRDWVGNAARGVVTLAGAEPTAASSNLK